MPNESPRQRRASQLREDQQRCREAAQRWRRELNQGVYNGMPSVGYDDLTYVSAILDTAAEGLDGMPAPHRRAILAFVGRLLDDAPRKATPVDSLTDPRGEGH